MLSFLYIHPMIIKDWIWEKCHYFLIAEKSRIFCWVSKKINTNCYFSVGSSRWLKDCSPSARYRHPPGFLDKIGAGVWKAHFTLKSKSLSLWTAWQWAESCRCINRGHDRSEDTPLPVPAQPSTDSNTAYPLMQEVRVQNWGSSLPAVEVGPVCKNSGETLHCR